MSAARRRKIPHRPSCGTAPGSRAAPRRITALALLVAGVLVPLQRRIQPQVERIFFADRYANIARRFPLAGSRAGGKKWRER